MSASHPIPPGWQPPPPLGWQPPPPAGWTPPLPDPSRLPTHLQPALPVEERDYYAFWRAPRYRWWKGLLAVVMGAFGFLVLSTVAAFVGWGIDGTDLTALAEGKLPPTGPGFLFANAVGLGLLIPLSMLIAWVCVQQRPRWLSSVVGGIRWKWLGLLVVVLLPLWLLVIGGTTLLGPLDDVRVREHTALVLVGVLLTTPFQAAGEEYLVRGLGGRAIGSWFRSPIVGFGAATLVTTVVFMSMHGAGDPWLNAFYVAFGLVCSWLTWRTGGLEAAVVVHAVHNTVSMLILPFVDFSEMFNREAGVGNASILIPIALLVVAAGIVEFLVRRYPQVLRTAPGRRELEALPAPPPHPGPGFGWSPGPTAGPR